VVMVLIYTHLGVTCLPIVILVNVILFIGIFSRMIPSQALMSAIPIPEDRGAYMAVSSSLQQFSGGVASWVAGLIVVESAGEGPLQRYGLLGMVASAGMIATIPLMYNVHRLVLGGSRGPASARPPGGAAVTGSDAA